MIILPRLFACTVVNERNERIRERDGKTERKNGTERKKERKRKRLEVYECKREQEEEVFVARRERREGEREREREEGREAAFTSIRNLLPYPILKYRG